MKPYIIFIVLPILLCIIAGVSLIVGDISISFFDIFSYLQTKNSVEYEVLEYIRIPRTVLAIAVGGGLSLAGLILQGVYRNPLVEPYTLGISGGASLGVTIAIVFGVSQAWAVSLPLFGFIGAFTTIFLVYKLSLKHSVVSIKRMLLIGVMISFVSSSAIMFLMSIASQDDLYSIVFWTMGSLHETNPIMVYGTLIVSIIILIISYIFVSPLNALRLGEGKANYLGINTQLVIKILFVITSVLTGTCIAVAGIIGFVGLIIPHIVRVWFGTNYAYILFATFCIGAIFLLICDILARIVIAPSELPIGVITGLFGGIVFIIILSRTKTKLL